MKKIVLTLFITILFLAGYSLWGYNKLSTIPVEKVILEIVNDKQIDYIPSFVAKQYLQWANFDASGTLDRSPTPYLNFSLFGYQNITGDSGPVSTSKQSSKKPNNTPVTNQANYSLQNKKKNIQNKTIFSIVQLLINKGADVNSIDPKTGWTPLHEAVLLNQPEVMQFLIKNAVDPNVKVDMPKSKYHGLDALAFAKRMAEETEHEDYTKVINVIAAYYQKYNKNLNANLKR